MHPAAALTIVGCAAWIAGIAIRDLCGNSILGWSGAGVTCVFIAVLWGVLRK